jgi:hypothetical protein
MVNKIMIEKIKIVNKQKDRQDQDMIDKNIKLQ